MDLGTERNIKALKNLLSGTNPKDLLTFSSTALKDNPITEVDEEVEANTENGSDDENVTSVENDANNKSGSDIDGDAVHENTETAKTPIQGKTPPAKLHQQNTTTPSSIVTSPITKTPPDGTQQNAILSKSPTPATSPLIVSHQKLITPSSKVTPPTAKKPSERTHHNAILSKSPIPAKSPLTGSMPLTSRSPLTGKSPPPILTPDTSSIIMPHLTPCNDSVIESSSTATSTKKNSAPVPQQTPTTYGRDNSTEVRYLRKSMHTRHVSSDEELRSPSKLRISNKSNHKRVLQQSNNRVSKSKSAVNIEVSDSDKEVINDALFFNSFL